MRHDLDALADALFRAFEANDTAAIEACCAPDARFAQNGGEPVAVSELLPSFATMRERIGSHRYTEVARGLFGDGFVEEHTVETVLPGGAPVRLRACVVARVDDSGRITELNEYLDPAPLRAASTAG